nr:MAG TPA_asm: hypothetical protein [Caudoviricetes sp.]
MPLHWAKLQQACKRLRTYALAANVQMCKCANVRMIE